MDEYKVVEKFEWDNIVQRILNTPPLVMVPNQILIGTIERASERVNEAEWLGSENPDRMLREITESFPAHRRQMTPYATDRKLRLFSCACLGMSRGWDWEHLPEVYEIAETGQPTPRFCSALEQAQSWCAGHPEPPTAIQKANLLREVFGNPFRPVRREGFRLVYDRLPPGQNLGSWLTWNNNTVPRIAQSIYENQEWDNLSVLADALEEAGYVPEETKEIAVTVLVYPDSPHGWAVAVSAPELMPRSPRKEYCRGRDEAITRGEEQFKVVWEGHTKGRGRWGTGKMVIPTPDPLLGHLRDSGVHVRGCWVVDLILGKS
jgi:hypothetical protein